MKRLFSASGSQYAFGAILHGLCYKGANALAHLFGSLGNQFLGRTVHISNNPMWKALARPAAFTTVAFLRHEQILMPPRGVDSNACQRTTLVHVLADEAKLRDRPMVT
jgi:hypothetical protein